jgi:hypothetical protein
VAADKKSTFLSSRCWISTGVYYRAGSNIDFYKQETIPGMGGVAFRWK